MAGAAALSLRKGAGPHRAFGTIFVLAILVMAASGAYLAALMPQRGTVIGGILTAYLAATAFATVRRTDGGVGLFEKAALLVAIGCAARMRCSA